MDIIDLDIRDFPRTKGCPIELVMNLVEKLGSNQLLQVHTSFNLSQLHRAAARRGHGHIAIALESKHFLTQFYIGDAHNNQFFIDARSKDTKDFWHLVRRLFASAQECSDPPSLVILSNGALGAFTRQLQDVLHDHSFAFRLVGDKTERGSIPWILIHPDPIHPCHTHQRVL